MLPTSSELILLLTEPKLYKDTTRHFVSTNRVYPVRIHNKRFVIKEFTPFSNLVYYYYKLRGYFPDYYPADVRLDHEVAQLKKLHSSGVTPHYHSHTSERILMQHLPGVSARHTIRNDPEHVLPLAFQKLRIIHDYNAIHGSAAIKNFVYASPDEGYWVDFDAPTPASSDLARANDLITLIRSSMHFTSQALPIALDTIDTYKHEKTDQKIITAVRTLFAS